MKIGKIDTVFFVGIGGIGMSALARYLYFLKKNVGGYDKTQTPITDTLRNLGIPITFKDDLASVASNFLQADTTLVVYTPAIKRNENQLLDYFMSNDYYVIKRATLLAEIANNSICMAVAGTHGKTTTSSILGHILKQSGLPATSFLGGIAENYNSNLILGGDQYTVVEADEFDRSFLALQPDFACITSVDADHLDIYNTPLALVETFKEFGQLVSKQLFVKKGLPIEATTYGLEEEADFDAFDLRIEKGAYIFNVKTPKETYNNIKIFLAGKHNVLNTMAALAMANSIGVSLQDIAKALLSYKGVYRRFSYRINTSQRVLIDDYAHHPTEIDAVFQAVKEMYPEDKILGVFQPHLYSRTRDFELGFIQSLAQFDELFLLPIYPAREHPIKGVSSIHLLEKIKAINKQVILVNPQDLFQKIQKNDKRIILMMGAGDIGEMINEIQLKLKKSIC